MDRPLVAPLVLVLLVIAAGLAPYLGRLGAVILVAVSVLWVAVNKPLEGVTIIELGAERGITVADMAAVAGFGLAALAWGRSSGDRD